jgi:hypothetical protein
MAGMRGAHGAALSAVITGESSRVQPCASSGAISPSSSASQPKAQWREAGCPSVMCGAKNCGQRSPSPARGASPNTRPLAQKKVGLAGVRTTVTVSRRSTSPPKRRTIRSV